MPTLSKPLSEFYSLDKELSQQGTRFTLSAGATFLPPNRILNDATIVIQHGTASLHRNNNHILYGIVQGPVIFGLAAGVSQIHNEYMLTAESDCRGYYLAANETLECLENHQLWCKHTCFSSTHFLRVPVFQPSAGTLPASGCSGIREGARCYIPLASVR